MGIGDKMKHEADKLAGKAQEGWGKLTGDDEDVAAGKAKQVGAEAAEAVDSAKDAAKDAVDSAKEHLSDNDR